MPEKTPDSTAVFPNDIEYLVFDRRKNEEIEFREEYKNRLNDILGHINNVRFMQKLFLLSDPTTPSIFEEMSLVNKGIDFIASSLVLLAHGSILESLAILRMAIESSCSALLIHSDSNAREEYFSNVNLFKSTKSITYAKTKIKYVGKLYGLTSNIAVHINNRTFGPKVVKKDDNGTLTINIEPFFLEESIADKKAFVLLIYLVTFIVERVNEIITIESLNNVIVSDKSEYTYISCSESSIDKIYTEFNNLIFDNSSVPIEETGVER